MYNIEEFINIIKNEKRGNFFEKTKLQKTYQFSNDFDDGAKHICWSNWNNYG